MLGDVSRGTGRLKVNNVLKMVSVDKNSFYCIIYKVVSVDKNSFYCIIYKVVSYGNKIT